MSSYQLRCNDLASHIDCMSQAPGGFQLLLNKYAIKTPGKRLLVLPTHSLALAVAAEWEWQVCVCGDGRVNQICRWPLTCLLQWPFQSSSSGFTVTECRFNTHVCSIGPAATGDSMMLDQGHTIE